MIDLHFSRKILYQKLKFSVNSVYNAAIVWHIWFHAIQGRGAGVVGGWECFDMIFSPIIARGTHDSSRLPHE